MNQKGVLDIDKPELRFRAFKDNWENKKITDLSSRINKQSTNDDDLPRVEYENIKSGLGMLIKKPQNNHKKGILFNKNDVLFGKLRPYLNNYLLTNFNGVAVGDFWVFRPNKNISSMFMYYLIQSERYQKFANYSAGSKMPRSDWNLVSGVDFAVPNDYEEQNKIGLFFTKIDKLIVLKINKISSLKRLKHAYLQKLFTNPYESKPKLRFKGFNDSWNDKRLKEIANIVGGGTPKTDVKEYWDGSINWFSPNELDGTPYVSDSNRKITELGFKKSSAKLHPVNTLLFTSRAGIGKMAILKKPATTNQGFQSLELKEGYNPYFIYSYNSELKRKAIRLSSGSTFDEISKSSMESIKLSVPMSKEQIKIGNAMELIDQQIDLQKKGLESLRSLKKGYLQKMFI